MFWDIDLGCPLPPFSCYVTCRLGEVPNVYGAQLTLPFQGDIQSPSCLLAGGSGVQLSGFKSLLCLLELCDDLASWSLSLFGCQMEKTGGPISWAAVRIKGDGDA